MKHLFVTCLSLILLAACTAAPASISAATALPAATPTAQGSSGIWGQVVLGPTCPVVQKDTPCVDRPYQATLTILTSSRQKVTQFTTGADGKFRISLSPGNYILHPESPNGAAYPTGREQTFTVVAGQFLELTVSYDSGMR